MRDVPRKSPGGITPEGEECLGSSATGTLIVIMIRRLNDSAIRNLPESTRAGKFRRVHRGVRALALVLFASAATQCEHKTFDLLPAPGEATAGTAGTEATAGTGGTAPISSAGAGTGAAAGIGGTSGGLGGTSFGGAGREGGSGGGNTNVAGRGGTGGGGQGGGGPIGGFPQGGFPIGCSKDPDPGICTDAMCDRCDGPGPGCGICDDDGWCSCSEDSDCPVGKACDKYVTERCLKRCEFDAPPSQDCVSCRAIAPHIPYGVCMTCPGLYCGPNGDWYCNVGTCVECRRDCECRWGKCINGRCGCTEHTDCRRNPDDQEWFCDMDSNRCERR
jgi:hypothetical protein